MKIDYVAVGFDPEVLNRMPDAQPPFSTVSGRRNLIAMIPGTGGGRSLALNCHLDVVPLGEEREWTRGQGEVVDNIIYGRGAYDDKSGVIICVEVLRSLLNTRLRGDVIVSSYSKMRRQGMGASFALRRTQAQTPQSSWMARVGIRESMSTRAISNSGSQSLAVPPRLACPIWK